MMRGNQHRPFQGIEQVPPLQSQDLEPSVLERWPISFPVAERSRVALPSMYSWRHSKPPVPVGWAKRSVPIEQDA